MGTHIRRPYSHPAEASKRAAAKVRAAAEAADDDGVDEREWMHERAAFAVFMEAAKEEDADEGGVQPSC